jgi:hypothetical protein
MLRTCSRIIAFTAIVAGPTAQAADTTLTLACSGTVTIKSSGPLEYDPDPVSMGLIVNFTARTVQGTARWGPYLFDDKLQITEWNEVTVVIPAANSWRTRSWQPRALPHSRATSTSHDDL